MESTFKTLGLDEVIQQGDEKKHHSEYQWEPVNGMIGHTPKTYMRGYTFRRRINQAGDHLNPAEGKG